MFQSRIFVGLFPTVDTYVVFALFCTDSEVSDKVCAFATLTVLSANWEDLGLDHRPFGRREPMIPLLVVDSATDNAGLTLTLFSAEAESRLKRRQHF